MGDFRPTPEQLQAADGFKTGRSLVIEAGAGTGKTSTLKYIARANPRKQGVYFAFNKAIAVDAQASFPDTVRCSTLHSIAYREVVTSEMRQRLNAPRQNGRAVAIALGMPNQALTLSEGLLIQPSHLGSLVTETVKQFCYSADEVIDGSHVPHVNGVRPGPDRAALVAHLLPFARKAWADIQSPTGRLKVTHDHYLKTYALRHIVMPVDYLLVDEAQDSNGVTIGIVLDQMAAGVQPVAVGDAQQAIYGWRGATNAMGAFDPEVVVQLTQSFRFGPAVAAEANKWLSLLGSQLRLKGLPDIYSRLGDLDGPTETGERAPDAILTRTNAAAIAQVMRLQVIPGMKVALVGGGDAILKLAEAAQQLKETGSTWHPELCAFTSWGQVQDFVDTEPAGSDLKALVTIVDSYGVDVIRSAVEGLANEDAANIVVSTAHKAKGREWPKVRIGSDFKDITDADDDEGDGEGLSLGEMRLAYVAVTRAKDVLDRGALASIDKVFQPTRA